MTKPAFRPIAPLDVDDAALESINNRLGVPTMVKAVDKPSRQDAEPPRQQAVKTASPQQKLTVRIPDYLVYTLKQNALNERTTVRHLVLLALQGAGYKVEAEDLLPGAGGSD